MLLLSPDWFYADYFRPNGATSPMPTIVPYSPTKYPRMSTGGHKKEELLIDAAMRCHSVDAIFQKWINQQSEVDPDQLG